MTTQFFLANFATTLAGDHAIDMAAIGDNVFIASNVVVSADGASASGIFSNFFSHRIDIAGSLVSGQFRGIAIEPTGGVGGGNVVTITASGGIFSNNQAIWILGDGANRIENAGTIETFAPGAHGILVSGVGNFIDNSGLITADGPGIFTGEGDAIINSGTIVSLNNIGVTFQTDFAGLSTLTNTGMISGVIGVGGSNGTEIVHNSGSIIGGVNLSFGDDQYLGEGGWVIGKINLGDGDDIGRGGDLSDTFEGGLGNDTLIGAGGDDTFLDAGGGIVDGNDTIDGGEGLDTYSAANAFIPTGVTIDLDEGLASGSTVGNDNLVSIENAIGSLFGDTITGDALANVLAGLDGADALIGAGGNDSITGGDGIDTMTGGAGRDMLYGEADGDADFFDFNSVTDSGITGGTRDRIFDFEDTLDKIDVSTIDAKMFLKGNQAFSYIGAGAFTSAGGQIKSTVTAGGNTLIQFNTDHDTAAEMSIVVIGTPTITAADFVL